MFTREDYERLRTAQRLLHDVLPKLDKGEACGIECSGYREIQAEALKTLEAIEREYFAEFRQTV